MKKIIFLLLLAPLVLSSFIIDDKTCLEIKGFLLDAKDKKLDKVNVSLMENGKEIRNLEAKIPFKMELPRDHYYSLVITKEGYLPAVIMVDTNVPKTHDECGFHFEFHYNMVPEQNSYNKEFIDFPAALVKYTKSGDEFVISEKYNTHIKKLIGAPPAN